MGAAAPMAPPKRADGGRKRVGLNEWSRKKEREWSGMNAAEGNSLSSINLHEVD